MQTKNLKLLLILGVIILILVGCQKAPSLALKDYGPKKIVAGEDFNVQKNGQSAMWAKAENATKTTVIVWGETQLKSAYGGPNNVTAIVPKELYPKPGQYKIYLLDTKNNTKSNSLDVTVQ